MLDMSLSGTSKIAQLLLAAYSTLIHRPDRRNRRNCNCPLLPVQRTRDWLPDMKSTDRALQTWRISKVKAYIPPGAKILDIGSVDGALFRQLGQTVGPGSMGIDPTLKAPLVVNGFTLYNGFFPAAMPADAGQFDIITMLAVLEHFPEDGYQSLRDGCATCLRPGGKLLLTVPSPQVDTLLKWLTFFRLIDGMSLEEHHGFRVEKTVEIFPAAKFRLVRHGRFQLGLNNLFVFERAGGRNSPVQTPA